MIPPRFKIVFIHYTSFRANGLPILEKIFYGKDELSGFVQFLKEQTVKTWEKPKKVLEGLKMHI